MRKRESDIEMAYATSFAEAIRAIREECRLTQVAMSAVVGVEHSTLSRLEAGKMPASRTIVERIIEGIGLASWEADRLRLAAGFAPKGAKRMVNVKLDGHERLVTV